MAQRRKVAFILLSAARRACEFRLRRRGRATLHAGRVTRAEGETAPMILIRLDSSTRRGRGPLRRVHFMELACTPFLRILAPLRTQNQNAVFSALCVAPCYHPLLGWRGEEKSGGVGEGEEERGLVSPAVIAVWPFLFFFFLNRGGVGAGICADDGVKSPKR